jgi:DMSO/TMAO reductase YedYZ molybdopterin-dependent catalytic subunit
MSDAAVEREMARRSFLAAGSAALGGLAGFQWLRTRRAEDRLPWPLRRALEINEGLWRDAFDERRLAPAFPPERARLPRANGSRGLDDDFDLAAWRLRVEGLAEREEPLEMTLHEVRALPRVEIVTELKCIEGWSEVVRWAGCSLREFAARYRPAEEATHVSLETPDGGYYVGLDLPSALHPQTLLCYEMNGEPLVPDHGAPLRLVIPVKYGIKNIKRIGTLRFTDRRPADYWAERGYDWYAAL